MKTPWHLWVIGTVSLLWNAGGIFDYIMMKTGNESYLANLTPEQLAYFTSFPSWVTVFWALGVWGAFLGSVLLLLRSRYALWAFAASLVGIAVNLVHGLFIADTPMTAVTTPAAQLFNVAIVAVALLLFWYARSMKQAGHLR